MLSNLRDEELVKNAQSGDKNCMDEILSRYRNYVKSRARCFFLVGSETEDLVQEGMIGLCEAIMDFSESKSVPFGAFARMCVHRQIISAIKSANRLKQKPLNDYVSLSFPSGVDSDENIYIDVVDEKIDSNPEEAVLNKELVRLLKEDIDRCLTTGEKAILRCYLSGSSYVEISEKLKKSTKYIDNALYRIRKKLKKNLNLDK